MRFSVLSSDTNTECKYEYVIFIFVCMSMYGRADALISLLTLSSPRCETAAQAGASDFWRRFRPKLGEHQMAPAVTVFDLWCRVQPELKGRPIT